HARPELAEDTTVERHREWQRQAEQAQIDAGMNEQGNQTAEERVAETRKQEEIRGRKEVMLPLGHRISTAESWKVKRWTDERGDGEERDDPREKQGERARRDLAGERVRRPHHLRFTKREDPEDDDELARAPSESWFAHADRPNSEASNSYERFR